MLILYSRQLTALESRLSAEFLRSVLIKPRLLEQNRYVTTLVDASKSAPPRPKSLRARFKAWPLDNMASRGDWSGVLERYAKMKDPQLKELGEDVHLFSDDKTVTIFDGYEKAKYHLLVMPRDPFLLEPSKEKLPSTSLHNLTKLLTSKDSIQVLRALEKTAEKVKGMMEEQMLEHEGFVWPINVGFHAAESMRHVHLHVISSDFISPKLKNKKHYNSFHPKAGFFLHLSDIIEQASRGPMSLAPASFYEPILKERMISFYDGTEYRELAKLKLHLEAEWGKLEKAGKAKEVKRKIAEEGEEGRVSVKKLKE